MTWRETVVKWVSDRLAVTAVPVGRKDDGLVETFGPVNRIDKPWGELFAEFEDAREAWRKNPLARRLVGIVTSYTVGSGISLHSEHKGLQDFIERFWLHNRMELRLDEWCDELSRSGELFPVLFTNPVDGMSSVRLVPAVQIEYVDADPEDYEREIRYKETVALTSAVNEIWWQGAGSDTADDARVPVMLHYAVNRPVGGLRGESDLAPLLPWLRRYSRWLEDRVRLNAAMRSFLWVVSVPARLRAQVEERYRQVPEPGSVIITEKDAETWEAVTPSLHAADAEKDGRAIRWMIVAGGPGTALLDIGEGEDSNLASGQAMAEQRRRFLRRRQSYMGWLLCDLVLRAYLRQTRVLPRPEGSRFKVAGMGDIQVNVPDISPEDNASLASAASALSGALATMATLTGSGPAYRRMALRLFTKFAGEQLGEGESTAILAEGEVEIGRREVREREMAAESEGEEDGEGEGEGRE
jgi:hypothetical protein